MATNLEVIGVTTISYRPLIALSD